MGRGGNKKLQSGGRKKREKFILMKIIYVFFKKSGEEVAHLKSQNVTLCLLELFFPSIKMHLSFIK